MNVGFIGLPYISIPSTYCNILIQPPGATACIKGSQDSPNLKGKYQANINGILPIMKKDSTTGL